MFDLLSGSTEEIFSYDENSGPVWSIDWDVTGQRFAYGRTTPDRSFIEFHVLTARVDVTLAEVSLVNPMQAGDSRIEFSPDGTYVAFGAPGKASTGDGASVQVRRLDGSLVFSSGGTGQLTWAGTPAKLYFQGASGVEAWDSSSGVVSTSERAWAYPIASPGGRWLAFTVPGVAFPGEMRVIDTTNASVVSLAYAGMPDAWVTPTLLRYSDRTPCGSPECLTRPVVYSALDGTKTVTVYAYVYATWPRSSPIWVS